MLEKLRAWLNGNRDFEEGKRLYFAVGKNLTLKRLLVQGKTEQCYKMLQNDLFAICSDMKASGEAKQATAAQTPAVAPETNKTALYEACVEEANVVYKQAMNPRAELLRKVQCLKVVNPNDPELVKEREQLAFDVVRFYSQASLLYERTDYVKQHGKLPEAAAAPKALDVSNTPDAMVYYYLVQYRKNAQKIKGRDKTSERVAMLLQYETDIKKLEERWHLLKQEHGQ